MLKAVLLALALTGFVAGPARADQAGDLVVGSVRDGRGAPVADADVLVLDASGAEVGRDRTDPLGTFAIAPVRPGLRLEVRCRHCRPAGAALHGATENVALVVDRYAALQSDVPDADDLAALPYGAPLDALGLIPFTIPAGASISDRGLGGGRGLVLDDGAPLDDLATGSSALADFPDRYVRTIAVTGPENAYRYGVFGGGGVFALDNLAPQSAAAGFDTGRFSSLALEPSLGNVYPAAGVSAGGGTLARRADLDYDGPFAGGSLRVGYGSGSETFAVASGDAARDVSTARLAYATASRRYRTFVDASATDVDEYGTPGGAGYRSAYLDANVRVERPGPVTVAAGADVDRQTAAYALGPPYSYSYVGSANDLTAYVDARAGDERASVDAGLAVTDVAAGETLPLGSPSGTHSALLPSLSARLALGGGAYARVGYSQSARLPTLLETSGVVPAPGAPPFERGELSESAIGFDSGNRVRAEAIAYREFEHGYDERRLDGIGLSLVWQIAPLVSIRAWSVRASPLAFPHSFVTTSDASRQVVWSTYANGDGLRFDAILHRDASAVVRPAFAFDADALLPVVARLAIDLGTAERAGARRYYAGLRARR